MESDSEVAETNDSSELGLAEAAKRTRAKRLLDKYSQRPIVKEILDLLHKKLDSTQDSSSKMGKSSFFIIIIK